ncbi:MAG: hypothetical protein P8N76_07370 [Pirellulaceae bacterium]|nr:hypothetical protein [Pirellulaceae bacterium]
MRWKCRERPNRITQQLLLPEATGGVNETRGDGWGQRSELPTAIPANGGFTHPLHD